MEDSLLRLLFFIGQDTSGWSLDEPVPAHPPLAEFTGPAGRYGTILRILASSPGVRPTVRDLLGNLTDVLLPGSGIRRRLVSS